MIRTKLSIITVCLNSGKTIEKTINSVLGQTFKDFEYIIVDGCSSDNTLDIVNAYRDRIDILVSEPDNGLYDAMNKGIQLASGDVIGIVNSDDWYEDGTLSTIAEAFESNNDIDIIYGDMNIIEPDKEPYRYHPPEFRKLWRLMSVNHPATFVRKRAYDKCGLYDTSYRISGDVDIMVRFWTNQLKFGHISKILSNFRVGGISSKFRQDNDYEVRRIVDQFFDEELFVKSSFDKLFDRRIPFYVWGAGRWGGFMTKHLSEQNVNISGVYDIDDSKWGTEIHSVKVVSPDDAGMNKQQILVAINNEDIDISAFIDRDKLKNCIIINIKECFELYEKALISKYGSCREIG